MEIKRLVLIILVFLASAFWAKVMAQEPIPNLYVEKNNKGFYLGGQAATSGFGLNAGYIINKRLTIKTGVETFNLNADFGFNENDIDYDANLKYKTGGVFLVGEYYYSSNLYLSGGAAFNSFNPEINGLAVSEMEYGDIFIPASKVGNFTFMVEPSLKVSPYLALGVRKIFGKKSGRVLFNFETGFYYMGSPQLEIETSGLLAPTSNPAHGQKEYLENQFKGYRFYPIVKLNLAFKLF